MKDLFDILPKYISLDNFCGSGGRYHYWEEEVVTPVLVGLGYERIRWSMGEYDSFGPLSRIVTVTKGDEVERYVYG